LEVLLFSILPFLGILLGLIVIHEAGHYITAKMFGVKVLEAGIGLPPRLWGFSWRGTDYTINAIPLGAFVRMLGEEDPEAQEEGDAPLRPGELNPESLAAQPKWKRVVIIGAGAAMNFIAAVILFAMSLMIPHPETVGGAEISNVAPNSPAQEADLRAGDQILSVNGREVDSTARAAYLIQLQRGNTMTMEVKRDDPREGSQILEKQVYARWNPQPGLDECGVQQPQGPTGIQIGAVSVLPISRTQQELADLKKANTEAFREYRTNIAEEAPAWCFSGSEFGFVGLAAAFCGTLDAETQAEARALRDELFPDSSNPCYEFRPGPAFEAITEDRSLSLFNAIPEGLRMSFESVILTRNQIWMLVRGFEGSSPVTGPVGIAHVTGEVVDEAGWLPLLTLAASISMSLALFNILPIPMVDGGRLVFIFLEFVRGGKRIAPEKEALVHFVGFVALILFAVVITYFDIVRIVGGDSILR
jgi:regulator of sigma E protease